MEQLQFNQLIAKLSELAKKFETAGQFNADPRVRDVLTDALGYTTQVTATNVSQPILPVNRHRKFLFVMNFDPVGYARIAFGAPATLTLGMPLAAGGGGVFLDNNVPKAQVNIIGSIAVNPNITLIEA